MIIKSLNICFMQCVAINVSITVMHSISKNIVIYSNTMISFAMIYRDNKFQYCPALLRYICMYFSSPDVFMRISTVCYTALRLIYLIIRRTVYILIQIFELVSLSCVRTPTNDWWVVLLMLLLIGIFS